MTSAGYEVLTVQADVSIEDCQNLISETISKH